MHSEAELDIFLPVPTVKPDPPSDVKVKQEEGHETWIKVTWNFPTSWKPQDRYYELIYEVKYRPLKSSFYHEQVCTGRPTAERLVMAVLEHVCPTYTVDLCVYFSGFSTPVHCWLFWPETITYSAVFHWSRCDVCLPGYLSVCVYVDRDD